MTQSYNYLKQSPQPAKLESPESKATVSFQRLSPEEQELIKRDIWDRALSETHRRIMSIHEELTNPIGILNLPDKSGIALIADQIHALNTDLRCWRGIK